MPAAQPATKAPDRGASGDLDLQVMLAELTASKACDLIEGQLTGLPARDRPSVVTGVLWIRHCKINIDGTSVTFGLSGTGWQWVEQTKHSGGGAFSVHQYIKFSVDATLSGTLDVAYDRPSHVMSLWFSPSQPPQIEFRALGDIEVDSEGMWSSMVGAASWVFSDSPSESGAADVQKQGRQQFESRLADGLTLAIDLCTGNQRSTLGRAAKGTMGKPGAGQSRLISVELQPDSVMVFGPLRARDGMIVDVRSDGPVGVGLACADQATAVADAFVRDRPLPSIATISRAEVRDRGRIQIGPTQCNVAFVAWSIGPTMVTFDWLRPPGEQALSTGGPIIRCAHRDDVAAPSGRLPVMAPTPPVPAR